MSDPKKIRLLIIDEALAVGGKEFLIHQHLKNLHRLQFEIHLITFWEKGYVLDLCKPLVDHYYCLRRRFKFDLIAIWKLRSYLRKHKIDLVHSNNWLVSLYLKFACRGLGVVKISTFHGYDRTWRNCIHLRVLKSFAAVVCVSRALKIDLYRMGLSWDKLAVITNCYDPEKFKYVCRPLSRKDTAFRMVMVSSFRWQKDQATLIRAVRCLKEQGHKLELHFVGGGAGQAINQCRKLARQYQLGKVVIFHGEKIIDRDFLADFDLFVFSSFSESFGIAPLEAMACGLPVLVSDIPALLELIQFGRCGCFFETGDFIDCADKINALIHNRQMLETLGKRGIIRAKDYRPKRVVTKLEELYQRLYNAPAQIE
jgi:glycosyltransferase involved in cell wall biosynthesis